MPRTNGFVERFNRTVLDEFFREAFRKKFYGSVDELQKDLDKWLDHYNRGRPHRGYRNQGRKPYETFTMRQRGGEFQLSLITRGENGIKAFYRGSYLRTGNADHARLNTQRKILAIMLAIWRDGTEYSDSTVTGKGA